MKFTEYISPFSQSFRTAKIKYHFSSITLDSYFCILHVEILVQLQELSEKCDDFPKNAVIFPKNAMIFPKMR